MTKGEDDFDRLFSGFKKEKKEMKKHHDGNPNEARQFTITYKPIILERLLYIIIILSLVGYIIFGYTTDECAHKSAVAVLENPPEPQEVEEQEPEVIEDDEPQEVEEPEPEPEPEPEEEEEEEPKGDGTVKLTIEDVNFEANDDGEPWKITNIKYIVENNNEEFKPTIKVYWYDADSEPTIKNLVRTSFTFGIELKVGQRISGTLKTFDSKFFNSDPKPESEVVKLELIDTATGKVLETKTKVIS